MLLTAKSKVSSMWGTSTPRVEMDGAVRAMRLAYRVVRALNKEDIAEAVWFLGDSETVLASREKEPGFFGEFSAIGLERLMITRLSFRRSLKWGTMEMESGGM